MKRVTLSSRLYCPLLMIPVFALLLMLSACSKQEESQSTEPASTSPSTMTENETGGSQANAESGKPMTTESDEPDKAGSETGTSSTEDISQPPSDTENKDQTSSAEQPAATPEMEAGENHKEPLALAKKSGCLACHAVDKKVIGPPWRDVSKRYKDDPDAKSKLVAKVAKGGRGNWTDVVGTAAMPPYSPRVSDENIAKLVDFVLSLEK